MPHYRKLTFSSRDHEMVSSEWFVLLWDITHHDHVGYNVNEGHRTERRQQELINEVGLFDSRTNPHGAAAVSPRAPHIKTGSPDHACDFDNASGVKVAARKRGVELINTVATESWHLEPEPTSLHIYYAKNHKRVYREAKGKKIVHIVKGKPPTHASNELIDMLASWEGERLEAYQVPGESFWTIGVGHTGKVNGKTIHRGMKVSKATSRKLLRADLKVAEDATKRLVPARWRRRQRRFDTCVSLTFNMGSEILTASQPLTSFGEVLKKRVNHITIQQAVNAIQLYNKGGVPLRVMPGLVKRRRAEGVLFKNGNYLHNV